MGNYSHVYITVLASYLNRTFGTERQSEEREVAYVLVLTRRVGESIRIIPSRSLDPGTTVEEPFADGPIEVHVSGIAGERVRIGIEADDRLVILRNELEERKEPGS